MMVKRKSRFVIFAALMAVVFALAGTASAASVGEAGASGSQAAVQCGDRYSPSGAHVSFCWEYGGFTGFHGEQSTMYRVWGTVYGVSFGQVEWVNEQGNAVWQSKARPDFSQYFVNVASLKFRACNSNGCGTFS